MIGFFEHQYLSYKKNHIRNLLALARADGNLHPREETLLFRIGRRYGLKDRQIKSILESDQPYRMVVPESLDNKLNQVCDLLLMIHADEKVEENEIRFVKDVVREFGLKEDLVHWLLDVFEKKGTPPAPHDWEEIKLEAKERFVL